MTRRNSLSTIRYPLSILLLLAIIGCGGGEYERRLEGRSAKMQAQLEAKFKSLGDPVDLGEGLSIRIPRLFPQSPLKSKDADPRRMKPGIVNLPGQRHAFEGTIQDSEGGQLPYYCYVGATTESMLDVANKVKNALTGKQGNIADWTDFRGDTPDGQGNAWRKLRFTGVQEFYYKRKDGKEQYPTVPGLLEVYIFDAGGKAAVVAWRMPASIEQNVGLEKLAPLVAGSVKK